MGLLHLIKKNLKVLIRSKASVLIFILGPVLVIFLTGLAFNNSDVYRLQIGAIPNDPNPGAEMFLSGLASEEFKIVNFDSSEDCVNGLMNAQVHACMEFNDNFQLGVNNHNGITFYVDFTKINLVYNILDRSTNIITSQSSDMSVNFTSVLLNKLQQTKNVIQQRKSVISELATRNDVIAQKLRGIVKTSSQDINLDIEALKNNYKNIQYDVEEVSKDAQYLASSNEQLLAVLTDSLSDMAITQSDKNEILDLFRESERDVFDLKAKLNTNLQLTKEDMSKLNKILEDANILNTKSKDQTSSLKSLVQQNINSLAQIQKSFNDVEKIIDSIKLEDSGDLLNPVKTTIKPLIAKKSHLTYIFPILIMLVVMFTSILLSSTLVILEKKSKASFRNYLSPTKGMTFTLSIFLTSLFLLLAQIALIFIVSSIFFNLELLVSLHLTLIVLFFIVILFTLIGMFIGYLFDSEHTSTLTSIFVASIFLFLSDVILPLESMPIGAARLLQFNPFIIGSDLLRRIILFRANINSSFITLIILSIIMFALVFWAQRNSISIAKYKK